MTARFLVGDVREQLATLEDNSVDLVLSSPPFLALRSYLPADHPDKGSEIGSEPTPGEFLDTILDVVEACERVLAPHGSLVFEFGDTYAGANGWGDQAGNARYPNRGNAGGAAQQPKGAGWPLDKSLTLIPESFAWALAYGRNPWTGRETPPWRIRNFCPWVRPNPPVGALGDKFRPGTSYLTVATKARDRWFDLDAVRTEFKSPETHQTTEYHQAGHKDQSRSPAGNIPVRKMTHAGAPPLDWFLIPTQPYPGAHYASFPEKLVLPFIESMCPRQVCRVCGEPRRRLTGETVLGSSRLAAHIRERREASGLTLKDVAKHFPSASGGVTGCAWNWENGANVPTPEQWPVLRDLLGLSDEFAQMLGVDSTITYSGHQRNGVGDRFDGRSSVYAERAARQAETLGWSDCGHNSWRNGVTLDPFAGSGTTLQVATGCGRDAIGIDLDERNAELAVERVGGLFLTVEHPTEEPAA